MDKTLLDASAAKLAIAMMAAAPHRELAEFRDVLRAFHDVCCDRGAVVQHVDLQPGTLPFAVQITRAALSSVRDLLGPELMKTRLKGSAELARQALLAASLHAAALEARFDQFAAAP